MCFGRESTRRQALTPYEDRLHACDVWWAEQTEQLEAMEETVRDMASVSETQLNSKCQR